MTVGKHTATVVVTGETKNATQELDKLQKKLESTEKKLEKANKRGGELGKTPSDPSKLGKAQSAFQGLTSSVGLLRAGYRVAVLDNFLFGQTPLLEWIHDENLRIVRGDARDAALLRELVSDADAVIPLACLTGAPLCDRDPTAARSVIVDAVDLLLGLLSRQQRDLPALFALLDRLDQASLAAQRRLTIPFVRDVLNQQ